jgi:hypothetical protein
MSTICQKCLTGRGQAVGEKCLTEGCDGIVQEEPLFKDLVDTMPEPITCGRRYESFISHSFPGPDHWEKFKTNGQRVCSYCGSLHPEDFFAMVKQSAETPEDVEYREAVRIEPSDKKYKIYVHQPGVRNAHEGGIKFYTHHLPRDANGKIDIPQEWHTEYAEAVRRTQIRFERYLRTI